MMVRGTCALCNEPIVADGLRFLSLPGGGYAGPYHGPCAIAASRSMTEFRKAVETEMMPYEKPTITPLDRREPLKAGDVVILRSGGPTMTVCGAHRVLAEVEWFVGGEVKRDSFAKSELVRVG